MNMKKWIKDHKKEIIYTALTITGIVVTGYIVYKNKDKVTAVMYTASEKIKKIKHKNFVEKCVDSKDSIKKLADNTMNLSELTGEYLTATDLGKEVAESNQTINKKLVEHGFVNKYSNGYELTDKGKKYGIEKFKERAWGYPFSNIEWDKSILKQLFSPEELAEKERKRLRALEILAECNYPGY